jgi:glycosyltransferase involved in cell wall biosynthesis
MRFLMLNWRDPKNPRAGGAERVTQAYLEGLKNRGHEIFWYANEFPGCTAAEIINGIHIVRGGGSGKSILKAIRWYREQEPFDLVIDQHHGIPWFAPWWSGTNTVSYLHEVLGPIWRAFYGWPISTLGQMQERSLQWLYKNVQFWVGSESTERALLERGVRRVKVIHYGIEQRPLEQLEPKPLGKPLRLIAVSRLAPNKRLDHAIRAVRVLSQKGVEAQLTIVGTGEVESLLRELAVDLQVTKQVTFAGRLPESEKDELLRQSHLLIHTSLREGWGLNVLEANAMGTPAVVYPVAGLVDSTIHDRTGMVTRDETPQSIAESLFQLLKTPEKYERYRLNARDRTRQFHWSRILPEACEWLEEQALGPKRPKPF